MYFIQWYLKRQKIFIWRIKSYGGGSRIYLIKSLFISKKNAKIN